MDDPVTRPRRRWPLALAIGVVALAAGLFAAYHLALRELRSTIERTLGPLGEVGAIVVAGSGVEIRDLRIRGGDGWPAEDQLRARRIVVVPDWRGLLSARIRLESIRIEGGYLSVLRARDGRLRVLPALLELPAGNPAAAPPAIRIDAIRLAGSGLDFFDATIRKPPLRLRLEDLEAGLDDLDLPELAARTTIRLDARIKGTHQDGKVTLQGWATIASRDSDLRLALRGVDLVALQPYLLKAADTGVRKGSLDLDLHSTVAGNRLRAPGNLTLSGLELASSGSFLGLPRTAAVTLMKDRKDRIAVRFVLEGDLADPRFSLNENLLARVGQSLAESLGISVEGLARGVGSAGRGIGEAVGKLFGK